MPFARFLASRAAQGLIVLLGVSAIVFFSLFLTGDPAALMLPPDASREEIDAFRTAMGYNDPIWLQYLRFLYDCVQGNLGDSLRFHRPAMTLVLERVPATALLAVTALAWSTLLGFVFGLIGAVWQDSWADYLVRLVALSGQAIPVFWLALLLILLFSLRLRILPTSGIGGIQHLILPAISLGAYYMSAVTRLVRASLIEVLAEDYVRTARAKGLSSWRIVMRHALRNALIPVVTVQGMYFASLLGGAVITEIIFAWPGIGRLAVQAIENRDFPLVQAVVLFAAAVFVVANLLVDISYGLLNPRIRL
jgi:peptide/nickel transport system permease protein